MFYTKIRSFLQKPLILSLPGQGILQTFDKYLTNFSFSFYTGATTKHLFATGR